MGNSKKEQLTQIFSVVNFFKDRCRSEGLTPKTILFYHERLALFLKYCAKENIQYIEKIDPIAIRSFIFWLQESGHNPGGVHACFRSLRAMFNWFEDEYEPERWKNPMHKIRAPKVPLEPLPPVDLKALTAMIDTCQKGDYEGDRDRAMLYFLLDTGCRAMEFLNIDIENVDMDNGTVLIVKGKGQKSRLVVIGRQVRRFLRLYLRHHSGSGALWVSSVGRRLTYAGLRDMLRRRATYAQVKTPSIHSFRRGFTLESLRHGLDVYTLRKLRGDKDLTVMLRYLAQTDEDLKEGHQRSSPGDLSL